jgi:hypothetical protein
MNKSIRLYLCIFVVSLLSGCANMPITESRWTPKKPDIRQPSPVTDDPAHIQGSQNVLYSIGNDSTNLYIKLMVADRKTQEKILKYGMSLWLDTTGHKKEKLGITYPLATKEYKGQEELRQQIQSGGSARDKAAQMAMRKRLLTSMIEMDIVGFTGPEALRVPALNESGLSATLLLDSNGALQYKAIIPFSLMHYHPASHSDKKSKPMTLGIVTGKMESQGNHGGSEPNGGGMQGGGRNGSIGGNSGMGNTEDPLDLWIKVKLAKF